MHDESDSSDSSSVPSSIERRNSSDDEDSDDKTSNSDSSTEAEDVENRLRRLMANQRHKRAQTYRKGADKDSAFFRGAPTASTINPNDISLWYTHDDTNAVCSFNTHSSHHLNVSRNISGAAAEQRVGALSHPPAPSNNASPSPPPIPATLWPPARTMYDTTSNAAAALIEPFCYPDRPDQYDHDESTIPYDDNGHYRASEQHIFTGSSDNSTRFDASAQHHRHYHDRSMSSTHPAVRYTGPRLNSDHTLTSNSSSSRHGGSFSTSYIIEHDQAHNTCPPITKCTGNSNAFCENHGDHRATMAHATPTQFLDKPGLASGSTINALPYDASETNPKTRPPLYAVQHALTDGNHRNRSESGKRPEKNKKVKKTKEQRKSGTSKGYREELDKKEKRKHREKERKKEKYKKNSGSRPRRRKHRGSETGNESERSGSSSNDSEPATKRMAGGRHRDRRSNAYDGCQRTVTGSPPVVSQPHGAAVAEGLLFYRQLLHRMLSAVRLPSGSRFDDRQRGSADGSRQQLSEVNRSQLKEEDIRRYFNTPSYYRPLLPLAYTTTLS